MYKLDNEVTREYLLKNLSQEQIMEHYLGLPIKTSKKFSSPLRKDKDPSCALYYKNGKLNFRDFGVNFTGDCFDVVMQKYGLQFWDALKLIAQDFNLTENTGTRVEKKEYPHLEEERNNDTPTEIRVKVRKWVNADKKYWFDRYGITRKVLDHFNVYPISVVWMNGIIIYNDSPERDPCYAYRLRKGEYKLYFPLRKRSDKRARFMHNTQRVQGYRQLPDTGKYVVMTKSMKDVMVLNMMGVPSVALISETTYPPEGLVESLKKRFHHVISLYDFDYAGIRMANHLKRKHGITLCMLDPEETGTKDIADYRESYGKDRTMELIEKVRYHLDDYFNDELEFSDEISY